VAKSGGDYTTIVAALGGCTSSFSNCIIQVMPGTYIENIGAASSGRSVVLKGSGSDITIIQAADPSLPTVRTECAKTVVTGFKIIGGSNAAVYSRTSGCPGPGLNKTTLSDNEILGRIDFSQGVDTIIERNVIKGSILFNGAYATIRENDISAPTSSDYAMSLGSAMLIIERNRIPVGRIAAGGPSTNVNFNIYNQLIETGFWPPATGRYNATTSGAAIAP
jgi:hypothetical protein